MFWVQDSQGYMLRPCLRLKKSIVISHDTQFMLIHSYLLILRINTTEVEILRGMVNRCLYDYIRKLRWLEYTLSSWFMRPFQKMIRFSEERRRIFLPISCELGWLLSFLALSHQTILAPSLSLPRAMLRSTPLWSTFFLHEYFCKYCVSDFNIDLEAE